MEQRKKRKRRSEESEKRKRESDVSDYINFLKNMASLAENLHDDTIHLKGLVMDILEIDYLHKFPNEKDELKKKEITDSTCKLKQTIIKLINHLRTKELFELQVNYCIPHDLLQKKLAAEEAEEQNSETE